MNKAIEIAMFRLAQGTSVSDFVATEHVIDSWYKKQPGYISRCMSRLEDDSWVDIAHWESTQAAEVAGQTFMQELGDSAFMRMVDPSSVKMMRGNIEVEA